MTSASTQYRVPLGAVQLRFSRARWDAGAEDATDTVELPSDPGPGPTRDVLLRDLVAVGMKPDQALQIGRALDIELRKAHDSSEAFLSAFRKEENPVGIFLKRNRFPDSPLYRVYEAGCLAIGGNRDRRRRYSAKLGHGLLHERRRRYAGVG